MAQNRSLAAYRPGVDTDNITPEMRQRLADFRSRWADVPMTSGYRGRNLLSKSQHAHGLAFDFSMRGLSEPQKAEIVNWWREKGATGIGYYPNSDSIHVDFRPSEQGFQAWGPNYSRTSLGQTPQWFQQIAAEHRGGQMPRRNTQVDDELFRLYMRPETPAAPAPAEPAPAPVIGSNGQPLPEITVRPEAAPAPDEDLFKLYMRPETPAEATAPAAPTGEAPGMLERFGRGVARGGQDVIESLQNLETYAAPKVARAMQAVGLIPAETVAAGDAAQANALQQRVAERNAFDAENPLLSMGGAGRLVGNMAATALPGAGAAGAVGAIPGMAARPIANMLLGGGAAGGLTAGLTSAASDAPVWQQVATGAGLGAVTAPIAGLAVEGGRRLGRAVADRLNPEARALGQLENALATSGQSRADIAARLASNPRLNVMDVDSAAQGLGMGLAPQQGKPREIISNALGQRMSEREQSIRGAFDTILGKSPDPVQLRDALAARARANADQGFTAALQNAKPADLSNAIQHLDNAINPGISGQVSVQSNIPRGPVPERLAAIRAQLTDGQSVLTDPRELHRIQSELGREARDLMRSATGSDKVMGRAIENTRQQIISSIDDASGGRFRPAQRQFADDMQVREAFEEGRAAFASGANNTPSDLRALLRGMPQAAQDAYRAGALTHIDRLLGETRNAARRGMELPESSFSREKLEILFGKERADNLARLMHDERSIAETNNLLLKGSQTSPREEAADAVRPRDVPTVAQSIGMGTIAPLVGTYGYLAGQPHALALGAAGTLAGLGRMGYQAAGRALDNRTNARLAEILTRQGPEAAQLIQLLTQRSAPRQFQPFGNALLNAPAMSAIMAGQGGNRLMAPQP